MTELTRRQMLFGTAAATLAAAVPFAAPSQVRAAAPAAGRQAPGFYRYKVGSIEVTVVTDGIIRFPVTIAWSSMPGKTRSMRALAAEFMEKDVYVTPFNPIVVNTGAKLAVIDTGTGEAAYRASQGANGQFLTNLAAAGIDADRVDAVIISHYHVDHVSGLLKADNSLAFPNAEILVPAREHKYWMDDGEMSRASTPRIEGVFKNVRRVMRPEVLKRLRTYEWDREVIPGVIAVRHAWSHAGSHVPHRDVRHEQGLRPGRPDPLPVSVCAQSRLASLRRSRSGAGRGHRRKVYDMLVAEKMLVQGFHYPFPALAHVEKTATGYREIPVVWNPTI